MRTTINLGNFENVVIEMEMEDRHRPELGESVDDAQERIYNKVESKVAEKAKKFTT